MDGVRILVYRSSINSISIILLVQWSTLLYWVGFLSFCMCYRYLSRSIYLRSILRHHIKELYYNRSINTLYMYMIIYGVCVAYTGYGCKAMLIWWVYVYMYVLCKVVYITMAYIKGSYIIRVHNTMGSI